ncbi:MAG TPA: sigma-70 family RNA polymerase sigma factor [Acidimicrobiales bacterium]|nr:sigma-70 family RNA polymerase sigma factor [Acidimicrobiales bacterium]
MSADWESVYRENVGFIYRLIFSRVGNRPDAEDLTSEVFRTALRPLRLSAADAEIRSYLRATAQTVLASYWRRRFGIEVTTLDPDSELPDFGDDLIESDSAKRAARILDGLPERYRHILELRFLEGQSIKEAAQVMNISVSNAKVLQHRALRLAAGVTEGRER